MPDFMLQSDIAIPVRVSSLQTAPVLAQRGQGFAQFMAASDSTIKAFDPHMQAPQLAGAASDGNEFAAGQSEASEDALADSAMDIIAFQGEQALSVIPSAADGAIAIAPGPDTGTQSDIVMPEKVTHASGAKLQIAEEIAARGEFVRSQSSTMPVGVGRMAEVAGMPEQQAMRAPSTPRSTRESLGFASLAPRPHDPEIVAQAGLSRADLLGDKTAPQAVVHTGAHLLMSAHDQGKQALAGAALAAFPAAQTAAFMTPVAAATSDKMQRITGMAAATPGQRLAAVTPTALAELQLIPGGIVPIAQRDAVPEVRHAMAELGDGVAASSVPGGGGAGVLGLAPGVAPSAATPGMVTLQIAQAFAQAHGDRFEVSLSPEELGRVRIQMHLSETGLHVLITTERPETLDFLRKNIAFLSRDLSGLGFNSTSFEFAGDSSDRHKGKRFTDGANLHPSDPPSAANLLGVQATMPLISGAGLDLRF